MYVCWKKSDNKIFPRGVYNISLKCSLILFQRLCTTCNVYYKSRPFEFVPTNWRRRVDIVLWSPFLMRTTLTSILAMKMIHVKMNNDVRFCWYNRIYLKHSLKNRLRIQNSPIQVCEVEFELITEWHRLPKYKPPL